MIRLLVPCLLAAATAWSATPPGKTSFLEEKKDVLAISVEQVRRTPGDAQKALKAGENSLRRLHENYKIAGSTPPTSLEGDVGELSAEVTKMRLDRSHGKTPPADPRAKTVIERTWSRYRSQVSALAGNIRMKRESGLSEGRVYWETLKDARELQEKTGEMLLFTTPEGEESLEESFAEDQWDLLKKLEDPARLRGRSACVKAPGENARPARFDVGPFYRAAGILPGTSPLRKEAFQLPPGCRTVTNREPGARVVLRSSHGRGHVVLGDQEKNLSYEYVLVPPEAPYFIENTGREHLDIELITLAP